MGKHLLLLVLLLGACNELPPTRPPPVILPGPEAGVQADGGVAPRLDGSPLLPDTSSKPKPDTGAPPKPDLPPPNPGLQLTAEEKDLIDAINKERASLGVGTVVADAKLMCTARAAAKSGSCGHYAGGSWIDRGIACGLTEAAAWKINEIATGPGFADGAECVWGWKQSSGHYWGLKHPQAKTIGVAKNGQGCWWAIFDCCIQGS